MGCLLKLGGSLPIKAWVPLRWKHWSCSWCNCCNCWSCAASSWGCAGAAAAAAGGACPAACALIVKRDRHRLLCIGALYSGVLHSFWRDIYIYICIYMYIWFRSVKATAAESPMINNEILEYLIDLLLKSKCKWKIWERLLARMAGETLPEPAFYTVLGHFLQKPGKTCFQSNFWPLRARRAQVLYVIKTNLLSGLESFVAKTLKINSCY